MATNKLIRRHMFDTSLKDGIMFKDEKITFDDLDPKLVIKLRNAGTIHKYNDAAIKNNISALENGKVKVPSGSINKVFVKDVDKFTPAMLATTESGGKPSTLSAYNNAVYINDHLRSEKIDKDELDVKYRRRREDKNDENHQVKKEIADYYPTDDFINIHDHSWIYAKDLGDNYNFTNAITTINMMDSSYTKNYKNTSSVTNAITAAVNNNSSLNSNKQDSAGLINYREKSKKIDFSELPAVIKNKVIVGNVNKIDEIGDKIYRLMHKNFVDNAYHKKSAKVTYADLDPKLKLYFDHIARCRPAGATNTGQATVKIQTEMQNARKDAFRINGKPFYSKFDRSLITNLSVSPQVTDASGTHYSETFNYLVCVLCNTLSDGRCSMAAAYNLLYYMLTGNIYITGSSFSLTPPPTSSSQTGGSLQPTTTVIPGLKNSIASASSVKSTVDSKASQITSIKQQIQNKINAIKAARGQ